MRAINYATFVGADVTELPGQFAQKVAAVLQDARGWRQFGYQFVDVSGSLSPKFGLPVPVFVPKYRESSVKPELVIRLETQSTAGRLCRGPFGPANYEFSCQRDTTPAEVVINLRNWMGGSASRLPLDRYRNYVINHEVGHFLGLEHAPCRCVFAPKYCPASVMMQMTRGPEHVAPCTENDWPLPSDNPALHRREGFGSGFRGSLWMLAVVFVLIIIFVVLGGLVCETSPARSETTMSPDR